MWWMIGSRKYLRVKSGKGIMRFIPLSLLLLPLCMALSPADLEAGKFGRIQSEKAVVKTSSSCAFDTPETHLNLVRGESVPCAFHTNKEKEPWVVLKLGRSVEVRALEIINRQNGSGDREANLTAWLSQDGVTWTKVWSAGSNAENSWIIPVSGEDGRGRKAAWVKLGTQQDNPEYFHLSRINVYGQ